MAAPRVKTGEIADDGMSESGQVGVLQLIVERDREWKSVR